MQVVADVLLLNLNVVFISENNAVMFVANHRGLSDTEMVKTESSMMFNPVF